MNRVFGLSALLLASVCLNLNQNVMAQVSQTEQAKLEQSQQTAPDNTSKNRRDKDYDTMTAEKAGNSKSDIAITRDIRKAIMATRGLSVDAQNVKIIVKDGVVTLRGPVKNDYEKSVIDGLVKNCAVQSFTDQLEVMGKTSQP